MPRIVHGNLHFPLVRDRTMRYWNRCERTIDEHATATVKAGQPYFLTCDHNDHSGNLFNPTGFKRLGGKGIDYIGVRLPDGWRLDPKEKTRPQSVTVLQRRTVHGSIDRHDFYGAKVLVVFANGGTARFWLVQANLGRGEGAPVFVANVKRIKRAFLGPTLFGFQEIDEDDQPQEHEQLRSQMPFPKYRAVGWGTMNPIVAREIATKNARISFACDGLAKYHPTRLLVEGSFDPIAAVPSR